MTVRPLPSWPKHVDLQAAGVCVTCTIALVVDPLGRTVEVPRVGPKMVVVFRMGVVT